MKNVNHVAPMLTLVPLLEQQENAQWRALVNEYGEWIEQGLLRTEMGDSPTPRLRAITKGNCGSIPCL